MATEASPTPHTAGPWSIYDRIPVVVVDKDGASICDAAPGNPHMPLNEAKANARLIAAAPDLLAALREIERGEGEFSRDQLTHATNCIESMRSIARAAIALATGEQPR